MLGIKRYVGRRFVISHGMAAAMHGMHTYYCCSNCCCFGSSTCESSSVSPCLLRYVAMCPTSHVRTCRLLATPLVPVSSENGDLHGVQEVWEPGSSFSRKYGAPMFSHSQENRDSPLEENRKAGIVINIIVTAYISVDSITKKAGRFE